MSDLSKLIWYELGDGLNATDVAEAEQSIMRYLSIELNKLDPPVVQHTDGKYYYMFEVEKLDNFLPKVTIK